MRRLPPISGTAIRNGVGLAALALIVAGIWGLTWWPWAAIATGVPVGGFYLWGEVRTARTGASSFDGDE